MQLSLIPDVSARDRVTWRNEETYQAYFLPPTKTWQTGGVVHSETEASERYDGTHHSDKGGGWDEWIWARTGSEDGYMHAK